MRLPVRITKLVGNQFLRCRNVGYPKQCLGQAHQYHALFRGQVVFLHEGFEQPLVLFANPNSGHQSLGSEVYPILGGGIEARLGQQCGDQLVFGHIVRLVNGHGLRLGNIHIGNQELAGTLVVHCATLFA